MENSGKIMVVDYEEINRKLIEAMLIPEGFEVIQANDGLECLNLLSQVELDIILMDIMMPKLDGFETTFRIKNSL